MTETFAIFRKDDAGYSTRGPASRALSYDDACDELVRLARTFPHQCFVIMREVATGEHRSAVVVLPSVPTRDLVALK